MLSEKQREVKRRFMKKSEAHYTEHRYLALMSIYDNEEVVSEGAITGRIYHIALKDRAFVNRVVATDILNKYNILINGKPVELSEYDLRRIPKTMRRYSKCIDDTATYFENRMLKVSEDRFILQLKKNAPNAYCYFEYKHQPTKEWVIGELKERLLYDTVIAPSSNEVPTN